MTNRERDLPRILADDFNIHGDLPNFPNMITIDNVPYQVRELFIGLIRYCVALEKRVAQLERRPDSGEEDA